MKLQNYLDLFSVFYSIYIGIAIYSSFYAGQLLPPFVKTDIQLFFHIFALQALLFLMLPRSRDYEYDSEHPNNWKKMYAFVMLLATVIFALVDGVWSILLLFPTYRIAYAINEVYGTVMVKDYFQRHMKLFFPTFLGMLSVIPVYLYSEYSYSHFGSRLFNIAINQNPIEALYPIGACVFFIATGVQIYLDLRTGRNSNGDLDSIMDEKPKLGSD